MSFTHIQRFSLHDGPGIRTTVFVKGCNLRCPWCHNPESLRPEPELQIFRDRCIGCGACVEACHRGAHTTVDGRRQFDRELCTACGACAARCYAGALGLIGTALTIDEVFAEVLADREFYDSSAGGVTVSGGEPLCQPELTGQVLKRCKAEGIHTAIETNLTWPRERVAAVLPMTDLVIADVKMMDPAAHRRWTGEENRQVLANARMVSSEGVPLIVRTPVVVGVNATAEHIGAVADFVVSLSSLLYYELVPYHPLGTAKYESLGMTAPGDGFARPDGPALRALAAEARRRGIEVRCPGEDANGGSPA